MTDEDFPGVVHLSFSLSMKPHGQRELENSQIYCLSGVSIHFNASGVCFFSPQTKGSMSNTHSAFFW